MSSTNKTTYYELSQYVGTDIINPLTDFNGDNEKIDAALHNIAEAAGSSATDITALTGRVSTAEGKITALETQNGNDVLTTTAQTLSGAVNELKNVNDTQSSTISAHTSSIDNLSARTTNAENDIANLESQAGSETLTTTAQTLSGAINEINGKVGVKVVKINEAIEVMGDGTKTRAELITELINSYADMVAAAPATHKFQLIAIETPSLYAGSMAQSYNKGGDTITAATLAAIATLATKVMNVMGIRALTNAPSVAIVQSIATNGTMTYSDKTTDVLSSTDTCKLLYNEYE